MIDDNEIQEGICITVINGATFYGVVHFFNKRRGEIYLSDWKNISESDDPWEKDFREWKEQNRIEEGIEIGE